LAKGIANSNEEKDYDQAIADFNEAIQLDPKSTTLLYRGMVYQNTGEYSRAIADYDEVIQLYPRLRPLTLKLRGKAYRGAGDYDHSIADLNEEGSSRCPRLVNM